MHQVHAQIQGRIHPGVITAGSCACCHLSAEFQGALWRTFCTAEQQRLISVLLRRSGDATRAQCTCRFASHYTAAPACVPARHAETVPLHSVC